MGKAYRMCRMLSAPLPRFLLLYAAMYAAYGVASPFLPAFLGARGLTPGELGLGTRGFWFMSALCALALPLAWRLRMRKADDQFAEPGRRTGLMLSP